MLLTELFSIVMIESGQFILGDSSEILFSIPRCWTLTKRWMAYYSTYRPIVRGTNIFISGTSYTFSDAADGSIPEWISVATLISVSGSRSVYNDVASSQIEMRNTTPRLAAIWRYESPTLFVNYGGSYDIKVHAPLRYSLIMNDRNELADVNLLDISETDYLFIKMITSNVLIAVGRSRRAFTQSDFPIQNDSADLVSEGTALMGEVTTELQETSYWHLGAGV